MFLVCFSLVEPESFARVTRKWVAEIHEQVKPSAPPIVLVGTKLDLRSKAQRTAPVSKEQGEALAKEIGAYKYVECSALTQVFK